MSDLAVKIFIRSHEILGFASILTALLALFATKGSRAHVRFGKVFVGIMVLILLPSFAFLIWRAFVWSEATIEREILTVYFLLHTLVCSASLWMAARASRLRQRTDGARTLINLSPPVIVSSQSLLVFWLGIQNGIFVLVAWALLCIWISYEHIRFWWFKPAGPDAWIHAHAKAMVDCFLTLITAIFVTLLPSWGIYEWSTDPLHWLGPFLLGRFFFTLWWVQRDSSPQA